MFYSNYVKLSKAIIRLTNCESLTLFYLGKDALMKKQNTKQHTLISNSTTFIYIRDTYASF